MPLTSVRCNIKLVWCSSFILAIFGLMINSNNLTPSCRKWQSEKLSWLVNLSILWAASTCHVSSECRCLTVLLQVLQCCIQKHFNDETTATKTTKFKMKIISGPCPRQDSGVLRPVAVNSTKLTFAWSSSLGNCKPEFSCRLISKSTENRLIFTWNWEKPEKRSLCRKLKMPTR